MLRSEAVLTPPAATAAACNICPCNEVMESWPPTFPVEAEAERPLRPFGELAALELGVEGVTMPPPPEEEFPCP